MTRLLTSVLALAAAGALVAGCGSDSSSSGSSDGGSAPAKTAAAPAATTAAPAAAASGGKLALKAVETNGLSFDHKTLSAKAGSVTITMDNPSGDSQPHAISVEGPGGVASSGQIAQPGSSSEVTVTLKPGKYTFYCPVGSHRAAGMEGTLTVQ